MAKQVLDGNNFRVREDFLLAFCPALIKSMLEHDELKGLDEGERE